MISQRETKSKRVRKLKLEPVQCNGSLQQASVNLAAAAAAAANKGWEAVDDVRAAPMAKPAAPRRGYLNGWSWS